MFHFEQCSKLFYCSKPCSVPSLLEQALRCSGRSIWNSEQDPGCSVEQHFEAVRSVHKCIVHCSNVERVFPEQKHTCRLQIHVLAQTRKVLSKNADCSCKNMFHMVLHGCVILLAKSYITCFCSKFMFVKEFCNKYVPTATISCFCNAKTYAKHMKFH